MAIKQGSIISTTQKSVPSSNPSSWASEGLSWYPSEASISTNLGVVRSPISNIRVKNSPIPTVFRNRNGVLNSNLEDTFYNRILIEPGSLLLGSIVSSQIRTISIFNAYFLPKTISSIELINGEGISLSGLTFPVTIGALQTVQLNVTVSSSGPAVIDTSLLFDSIGTSDDIAVSITGARLVGLPFQGRAPMAEQLEWKTDVLTSSNNKEQRIRVRNNPRQSFSLSYPISKEHHNLANNLSHGWQFRRWAIPLWNEVQNVGTVASGATSINCSTVNFDIRANALIMLWESVDKNEIIEVDTLTASNVTLTRSVAQNFTNAILMPVRLCRNLGGIGRDTSGFESFLLAKFEALDNTRFPVVVPPQYQGHDLYLDEDLLLVGDANRHAIKARVDTLDFKFAVPEFDSPWQYARATWPMVVLKEGPVENWVWKQFLHRRAGKLRAFWIPTFENDFEMLPTQTGLVTTSIAIRENQYRQFARSHRRDIAIELDTGSWVAARINGTSDIDSTSFTIALDVTLNVQATQIKRISYLDLVRLDSDMVTIQWQGNGVSSCEINLKQIEA